MKVVTIAGVFLLGFLCLEIFVRAVNRGTRVLENYEENLSTYYYGNYEDF